MLSPKGFLLGVALPVPCSGTGWGRRGGKDAPPPNVLGAMLTLPSQARLPHAASLARGSCPMAISGASVGVPRISWDRALVQAEEALDRQQRRSEENCNENQAKGCQSHKVRYEILMGPCRAGMEVWRSW